MKIQGLQRFWDGETISVVCNGRKPLPNTNTIGFNGDEADVLWVTRPLNVIDDMASLCISINQQHPSHYEFLLSGCPGCGKDYDIFNQRKIFHWQQPEIACVELALKLGATTVYIQDPIDRIRVLVKDSAILFAEKGILVTFDVIEESLNSNSMEDFTDG